MIKRCSPPEFTFDEPVAARMINKMLAWRYYLANS